jgi:hypothetical protein
VVCESQLAQPANWSQTVDFLFGEALRQVAAKSKRSQVSAPQKFQFRAWLGVAIDKDLLSSAWSASANSYPL